MTISGHSHMRTYGILVPKPVTPDALIAYSYAVEKTLEPQEVGQTNSRNADIRHQSRLALECAEQMLRQGIAEAKHFGPFSTELFADDEIVKIKAGAVRFSTHPQVGRNGEIVPRDFKVKVWHAYAGYTDHHRDGGIRHPTVHWVGRGSYFFWTDASNVEAISD